MKYSFVSKQVNVVLNVHRNHKAHLGWGGGGEGGIEVVVWSTVINAEARYTVALRSQKP